MESGAEFRNYRKHRLLLWRKFGDRGKCLNFVMLNPSSADEKENDRTIDKCVSIAKANGFDEIMVTNLFSLVATEPKKLYESNKLNLEENDDFILETAGKCKMTVCAWGNHGKRFREREQQVIAMLKRKTKILFCLKKNIGGAPKHPLYCKGDTKPAAYA